MVPEIVLDIGVLSSDPKFQGRLTGSLSRIYGVNSIRVFREAASLLKHVQRKAVNAAIIDLFTTNTRMGVKLIEMLREDYRDVPICLLGTQEELASFRGVPPVWKRRFSHYFALRKDESPQFLNARIEEQVVRLANWVRGRYFIMLSTDPREEVFRRTAFVMMWIDPNRPGLKEVYATYKAAFAKHRIKAIRADDIRHGESVTSVVLEYIRKSDYLVADLSGERPNVYYEIGYAHALGRRPLLFKQEGTRIHFDIAGYKVLQYRTPGGLHRSLDTELAELARSRRQEH